jgi:ABC-2 type transport system permease protein
MLGVLSGIMGYFICANIEIILGLLAFWFYDLKLVHNAYEVVYIMLGGINIPLYLFPHFLEQIAFFTPLPYVLYVPTLLLTGQVAGSVVSSLIAQQILWLIITSILYRIIWKRGIRVYTASGS